MAQNLSTSATASDRIAAHVLARTSVWVSVVGIVVGTVVILVIISVTACRL